MAMNLKIDEKTFENRVLRMMFRSKERRLTGGWKKNLNDKCHNLYTCPNIISVIR
jgi:hypothetical protein